jgi:anaerobic glycerol-3-phosphate dehydrogenase
LDVAAPVQDGNAVHVTVHNVTSLAQAAAFKGAIAQRLRRVKAVAQRSYSEGTQELDVTLAGSTEEFAQQLEAKRLGKFTVRVTALSAKSVEVELGR